MAEQFNFDQFLMERGFSFTNYGSHNLYEIAHEGHHYAVNLQGKKMTTNQSRTGDMLPDIAVPNDLKSAEKWHGEFFGVKSANVEQKTETVAKVEPVTPASKTAVKTKTRSTRK